VLLLARAVLVAELSQPPVAAPAVGVDDRPGRGCRLDQVIERLHRGVLEHPQAHAPRPGSADLDHDAHQGFLAPLTAAFEAHLLTAEIELVDLHLILERLTLGRHHRPSELLQDQPRRLIAREPELALQLSGRDPRMMGRDQIRRPEPQPQRRASPVHDRARRHRRLGMTDDALPQMTPLQHPRSPALAHRTNKAIRPPARRQILHTRRLRREPPPEIHDRTREVWPRHRRTVQTQPDGTGYALERYASSSSVRRSDSSGWRPVTRQVAVRGTEGFVEATVRGPARGVVVRVVGSTRAISRRGGWCGRLLDGSSWRVAPLEVWLYVELGYSIHVWTIARRLPVRKVRA
jgi:hypothetical protein